jgi:RNA polymerase sigma-70 factor (ECF subfamily)
MTQNELIPHLFRTEFSKISSVLSKYFGIGHIEIAEDTTSETFLAALETWSYKGIPENPVAWLYAVAKNKAVNQLNRQRTYAQNVLPGVKNELATYAVAEIDLSEKNIFDSQLQMLFAICHPGIPVEAQIGLALRILCGFGIEEIADAFLTNKETINKRLFRAREKLRAENIAIEFPPPHEAQHRLDAVLRTLYLLFSEGYYSESNDNIVREELCREAMRLTNLLLQNEMTNQPAVNALMALMCFHTSRFAARKDDRGELILYHDQDESLWDKEMIARGVYYMHQASTGNVVSKYHLEAAIAWWHTNKEDSREKWESILQLYNQLLQIEYSPIAALNRTFALSKANGKQEAIIEAEKLKLDSNPYYHSLLGELYRDIDPAKAKHHLETALTLAKTQGDKQVIAHKLSMLV